MKLSEELNQLLSDPFLRKHWDLSMECLMLFQRALEAEEALAARQSRTPLANRGRQPRTPAPAPTSYRAKLRNLTPPRYLQTSPQTSINPEVLLIFGD